MNDIKERSVNVSNRFHPVQPWGYPFSTLLHDLAVEFEMQKKIVEYKERKRKIKIAEKKKDK